MRACTQRRAAGRCARLIHMRFGETVTDSAKISMDSARGSPSRLRQTAYIPRPPTHTPSIRTASIAQINVSIGQRDRTAPVLEPRAGGPTHNSRRHEARRSENGFRNFGAPLTGDELWYSGSASELGIAQTREEAFFLICGQRTNVRSVCVRPGGPIRSQSSCLWAGGTSTGKVRFLSLGLVLRSYLSAQRQCVAVAVAPFRPSWESDDARNRTKLLFVDTILDT